MNRPEGGGMVRGNLPILAPWALRGMGRGARLYISARLHWGEDEGSNQDCDLATPRGQPGRVVTLTRKGECSSGGVKTCGFWSI